MKALFLIVLFLSACTSNKVVVTDEEKLQYLKENTFVNRHNTVSKDLVVIYTLRQIFPLDKEFYLSGDSSFGIDSVKSVLKAEGFYLRDCAKGITRISFSEVFEPEPNFYTFKYMVWSGPLAASSQQCKVRIYDFTKKENIECKILWVS